jgi:hypothetical protein
VRGASRVSEVPTSVVRPASRAACRHYTISRCCAPRSSLRKVSSQLWTKSAPDSGFGLGAVAGQLADPLDARHLVGRRDRLVGLVRPTIANRV